MQETGSAIHHEPPGRGDVIRIVVGAATAALAAGFIADSFDGDAVPAVARMGLAVALIALLLIGLEIRMARRLARLEESVRRLRWDAYDAAFADLSARGGETSTDHGHLPPRR